MNIVMKTKSKLSTSIFLAFLLLAINSIGCERGDGVESFQRVGQVDVTDVGKENLNSPVPVVGKIKIMASTDIIADLVNKVGGDRISVDSIIPGPVDPHHYSISAKDVVKIIEADHIFAVGLQYEDRNLTNLLDGQANVQKVYLGEFVDPLKFRNSENGTTHAPEEHEEHGKYDPHFWFDPLRVAQAVEKIGGELAKIDPPGAPYYREKVENYIGQLKLLHEYIIQEFEKIPPNKRIVMTSHESLGYLGDRYNVEILRAVVPDLDSGIGPSPRDLVSAIEAVERNEISVIFLDSRFNDESARRVAEETGINVVSGLEVESLGSTGSYVNMMMLNVKILVSNLS